MMQVSKAGFQNIDKQCIFKRLDWVLYNYNIQDLFPVFEMENLLRHGSDYAPLLINVDIVKKNIVRTFRFLNFCIKEKSFLKVVKGTGQQILKGILFWYFTTR